MLSSSRIKSHPDKFLFDHLRQVSDVAIKIYEDNPLEFTQIKNVDPRILIKLLCLTHDLGKSTIYFQEFRLKDKNLENELLGNHAALSSLFTYSFIEEFLNQSTFNEQDKGIISFLLFQAVRRHHGNLNNFDYETITRDDPRSFNREIISKQIKSIKENYFDDFKNILSYIAEEIGIKLEVDIFLEKVLDVDHFRRLVYPIDGHISKNYSKNILIFYLEFSYLWGILLYSDKMSLADKEEEYLFNYYNEKCNYFEQYKNKLGTITSNNTSQVKLNELRCKAFEEAHKIILENLEENLFVLNLPTGLGKTVISLSLAHNLINNSKNKSRIVYCLPFTSIIEQVSSDLKEKIMPKQFQEKSLKFLNEHHHLVKYNSCSGDNKEEFCVNSKVFIESWSSEIIITTFEQILHSLINNQNMSNMKIAKLQNSVLILDEVQSLPLEYYGLISELIKALISTFNCRIIISTATYPLIVDSRSISLVKSDHYFNNVDRTKLINNSNSIVSLSKFIEEIKQIITENASSLIICNTITQSKMVLEALFGGRNYEDYRFFFLSTHITPKERKERIRDIKQYRVENKKLVVVSTQLIEAGVDLDFDVVIRDFAPLDSIIQAGGRCNRNNLAEVRGKIFLFKVCDENNNIYAQKIYSSINLQITSELLKNFTEEDERNYYPLIQKYYTQIKMKRDSKSKGNEIVNLLSEWNIKDASERFTLIKQQDKRDVFVILDLESQKLLDKFMEYIQQKEFKKAAKLRSLMNQYIIQVYFKNIEETLLSKVIDSEEFYYIKKLKSQDIKLHQYDNTMNCGLGFVSNSDNII